MWLSEWTRTCGRATRASGPADRATGSGGGSRGGGGPRSGLLANRGCSTVVDSSEGGKRSLDKHDVGLALRRCLSVGLVTKLL